MQYSRFLKKSYRFQRSCFFVSYPLKLLMSMSVVRVLVGVPVPVSVRVPVIVPVLVRVLTSVLFPVSVRVPVNVSVPVCVSVPVNISVLSACMPESVVHCPLSITLSHILCPLSVVTKSPVPCPVFMWEFCHSYFKGLTFNAYFCQKSLRITFKVTFVNNGHLSVLVTSRMNGNG
jgi:hypothetical protein